MVFIVGVACFDVYCTAAQHDTLLDFEQNRIAKMLLCQRVKHVIHSKGTSYIMFSTVDVSALILVKTVGLVGATALLQYIDQRMKQRIVAAIVIPVALFMLGLLLFLTVSIP